MSSEDELIESFFKEDTYKEKREQIRDRFFEKKEQLASKNILDTILLNNQKVKN